MKQSLALCACVLCNFGFAMAGAESGSGEPPATDAPEIEAPADGETPDAEG